MQRTNNMSTFTFEVLSNSVSIFMESPLKGIQYLRDNTSPTPFVTRHIDKLEKFVTTGIPQFSIFVDGNDKLGKKFLAFSSVSGADTCPGAGQCLTFCYTFKGWRTLAPFCRQIQNMILLSTDSGFQLIVQDLDKNLRRRKFKSRLVDLRLYVDGDFKDKREINLWMETIGQRPSLRAYGYSKSLDLFYEMALNQADVPFNYKLNLSTGGKYDYLHDEIMRIKPSWVRGRFVAVPTVHTSMASITSEHKNIMRAWSRGRYGKDSKSFVCPSKCGNCTPRGHACGSDRFDGINILIPVH